MDSVPSHPSNDLLNISKHPGAIFVQLTTACNAKCINCPHPVTYGQKGNHQKGVMTDDIWNKIIRDIQAMGYRNQVGLYLHHEPLLDRSLFKKIRQIHEETEAFVVISTNGSLLNDKNRKALIDAKPRIVHININSAEKDQYEKMTGLSFETTIHHTKLFISEAAGKVHVEINCPVLPEVDTEKLINLFPGVQVNTDYWANSRGGLLEGITSKDHGSRFKISNYCLQPGQNFNVLFDGSVIICCLDWSHESKKDFPNIMNSCILEIYGGDLMQSIIRDFKNGNYGRYQICKHCSEEMGFINKNMPVVSFGTQIHQSKDTNAKNTIHADATLSKKVSGKRDNLKPLSILLATNHLFDYTGSEITLLTIAKLLKEKGHNISVYGKYIDPLFIKYSNHHVPVFDDLRKISKNQFDAAYVQHHPIALEVRYQFPTLPIFLASLGVLPFLEQPPLVDLGIHKYLAISEEVKANLMRKGIDETAITIFRNIVDSRKFKPTRTLNQRPQTAFIYSYKINEEKIAMLMKACTALKIHCRHIGKKPGAIHQDDLATRLNEADIVFTLGRGAIETMMCGKIPIIFDYQGGDGMVTRDNITRLMTYNFSGRLFGKQYTVDEIIQEINLYNAVNAPILQKLAIDFFDAEQSVDRLVSYLRDASQSSNRTKGSTDEEAVKALLQIINTTKDYTVETIRRQQVMYSQKSKSSADPKALSPHSGDRQATNILNPKVSIIIPLFNKLEYTQKCLAAMKKNTPEGLYELIIINNGSADGTAAFLQTLAGTRIITNNENAGFAKACNQGAQTATSPYLLFLNNDTEPRKGWLEPLLTILDNDQTAVAAGSKLLFPDDTIQHAGVLIIEDRKLPDPLVARHIYYQQPSDLPEANQLRIYQALTAACILIRKDAYEEAGGFDEGYWNGYEDIDLCFKLQENGGEAGLSTCKRCRSS